MFASVIWPKGKPPSDVPECGFNDELCERLTSGEAQFRTETYKRIINTYIYYFQLKIIRAIIFVDTEIALLAVLVTFPLIGVVAVLWIGVLMLQKFRLQMRLDDSNWWIINYSDITIIREPSVRAFK